MYELIRLNSLKQLFVRQLPSLLIAMVIAEIFYKLGSFTLECVAFLVTWFVVDSVFSLLGIGNKEPVG